MVKVLQTLVVGISILYLPTLASPTNWLYNAPRALFGLASSASASASSTPISYIADLRRREEKSEKLQDDKGFSEQTELLDGTNDKEESSGDGEGVNEGNNEAAPSLLEKKVNKILAKLRLIAQIKNAYNYNPAMHEHESNITFTSEETTASTIQKTNSTVTIEIGDKEDLQEDPNVNSRKITTIKTIKPSAAYGVPKEPIKLPEDKNKVESGPVRVEIDVSQINDKLENFNAPKKENVTEGRPERFGSLGVFFAELIGSIVGLTYGAFAQITSG